jgi:hypothetical protein
MCSVQNTGQYTEMHDYQMYYRNVIVGVTLHSVSEME